MDISKMLLLNKKYIIPNHGIILIGTDGINLLEKHLPLPFDNLLYILDKKNLIEAIKNNEKYSTIYIHNSFYVKDLDFRELLKYIYSVYVSNSCQKITNYLQSEKFICIENNFFINSKYLRYKLEDGGDDLKTPDYKDFYDKMNFIFDEDYYLSKYPDIEIAVRNGFFKSGYEHYTKYGKNEGRLINPF